MAMPGCTWKAVVAAAPKYFSIEARTDALSILGESASAPTVHKRLAEGIVCRLVSDRRRLTHAEIFEALQLFPW